MFKNVKRPQKPHLTIFIANPNFFMIFSTMTLFAKVLLKKTCVIRQYSAEVVDKKIVLEWLNGFNFQLRLKSPASTNGHRLLKPYKTIRKEYYIMDIFQLIGSIGGTLGPMIGFSFIGSLTSIGVWTS